MNNSLDKKLKQEQEYINKDIDLLNVDVVKSNKLEDIVELKLQESLDNFKKEISEIRRIDEYKKDFEINNLDRIDRSFYLFNLDSEGKYINEMHKSSEVLNSFELSKNNIIDNSYLIDSSNSNNVMSKILTEENLKIFKEKFAIESLLEKIKVREGLSSEVLKRFEIIGDVNINIDECNNDKLITIEGTKLKINLDLKRSAEIWVKGLELIKGLKEEDLIVYGSIVPSLGSYMFYKKISNLYADHLNKNLNLSGPKNKLVQLRINNQSLLIFNIFACLSTAIIFSGSVQAIKNTVSSKISISSLLNSEDAIDKGSNITKSILPLFILTKFKKIPKWIKIIFMCMCVFLVKLNYSYISLRREYLNYTNLFIFIIIFLLYIIYFIFKLLMIINFINYKDNLLENKLYKYLPASIKESIIAYQDLDFESEQIIIKQNKFLVKLNSLLIVIILIYLIIIYFVLN